MWTMRTELPDGRREGRDVERVQGLTGKRASGRQRTNQRFGEEVISPSFLKNIF